jgi:hypothetical protein
MRHHGLMASSHSLSDLRRLVSFVHSVAAAQLYLLYLNTTSASIFYVAFSVLAQQHGTATTCHRHVRPGRHGPHHPFLHAFLLKQRGTHTCPRRLFRQIKRQDNNTCATCGRPNRRIERRRHCAQARERDSQVRPELPPRSPLWRDLFFVTDANHLFSVSPEPS